MKISKRLLQLLVAALVVAAPLAAQAQVPPSYGPYGAAFGAYGAPFGPVVTPLPALAGALDGTPLDPFATTIHIVPPTGGTVMLYRGNAIRGWWMQPGLTTVRPDTVYSLVATRGTQVLYASGILFRPGHTAIAWRGDSFPQIAYQPAWPPGAYPYDRYASRPRSSGAHAARPTDTPSGRTDARPHAQPTQAPASETAAPASRLAGKKALRADLRQASTKARAPRSAIAERDDKTFAKAVRLAPIRKVAESNDDATSSQPARRHRLGLAARSASKSASSVR